jgi:hypothetical protein
MADRKSELDRLKRARHLLAVEGYSDQQLLIGLLDHLGIYNEDDFFVKPMNGKRELTKREVLKTLLKIDAISHLQTISFFLDADNLTQEASAADTIRSISDAVQSVLGRTLAHGEWLGDSPQLGLFVFPDGQSPGELETLIWNAMPDEPPFHGAKTSVDGHLVTMNSLGWPWKSEHKAKVGTYLAAAWDDDPRPGPAARNRKERDPVTIDFSWPGFERLRSFLAHLAS